MRPFSHQPSSSTNTMLERDLLEDADNPDAKPKNDQDKNEKVIQVVEVADDDSSDDSSDDDSTDDDDSSSNSDSSSDDDDDSDDSSDDSSDDGK